MPNALIVEDDADALQALTMLVENLGFSAVTAASWGDARTELLRASHDVVLLDVFLPGGSGLDLLLEVPKEHRPRVVLMSGDESIASAFESMPMQELHFVPKPVDPKLLERTLESIRRKCGARREPSGNPPLVGTARLQGDSPAMARVRELVSKVAPLDMSVYVEGESGTGKELVALAVHEMSPRRGEPFVALNCGALPENLIDSELFGHTRGAFTGAVKSKAGVFEQAHGGTLFLDEVAEMPVNLQVRLLRTLESNRVRPVGGDKEIEVDVRVVAATNRRFEQAIAEGRFREDLFHRLCVFPIVLPPLRERREDVQLLAELFRAELDLETGRERPLAPETHERLATYDWPGNVRQLRNAVQRAYVMADRVITPDCLPSQISGSPASPARRRGEDDAEAIRLRVGTSIADAERRLIEATLKSHSGDKVVAAEILGLSLRTLYNRLKDYSAEELEG
jgi:DNA-binding NtrC family response regulator